MTMAYFVTILYIVLKNCEALTLLYNGMLIHGVSPSELLIGTMVPLQKDNRNSHHSSDNSRVLTLGSIIGKLFDAIIIKQQNGVFDQICKLGLKRRLVYNNVFIYGKMNHFILRD